MAKQNDTGKANIQANDNSVAVGKIEINGNLQGNINIGNTGFTSEEVSTLLMQITSTFQPKPFDGRCPYKGLDVFEEEDAELFFGREKLVDDLVSRVKDSRTVFVTGPSGSGKSSLVRAGLIHALKQGAIKGSERWLYATMKPGRDALESLANSFSRLKSPELGNYFRKNANQVSVLHECAESVLTDNKNQRLVLFIDQFEEVFTQISNEEERVAILNLLTHVATIANGRVIILFSMRSDFVSNCATYPQLNALLNQQFVQIGAMQPEELVSAIAEPALRVGLRIDPDLIAQIINDMKGEPGALPLMSFALKDLFEKEQAKGGLIALTLSSYLENKGINEALQRHADATLAQLSEHEKKLAQSIFSNLIEIGRGTQDTKRTASFGELIPPNAKPEEVQSVIQKLADARLVTTEEGSGKYTITHEKLIDAWPWLKKLINENREAIALQNEISADTKEWEDNKRDASYLYTGGRLANIWEQVEKQKLALGELTYEFVRAGRRRQQKTRAVMISAVSVILIAAIGASVVFKNQAQVNAEIANFAFTQQAAAQSASTFAVAQQVTAQANADNAQNQANIAFARQLASQAQSINNTHPSKQMIASLLSIQSFKLFPNAEASSFLINNNQSVPTASKMTHDDWVTSVTFSPDGKYVVSGSSDGTARVWEATTGKEIARMTHDEIVFSVTFSPDGRYVLSSSHDGTSRIWETATGKETIRFIHDIAVTFSRDGKYIALISDYSNVNVLESEYSTVRVLEMATGKETARMTHYNRVTSVAFSPDGKYVVSGSFDNTARVWEAATGKETARMTHDDQVNSVDFSPDGKYVVSGSSDNTARVWEATIGKETARMTHDHDVYIVDFSPDSKYVVSGSGDLSARVWEVATGIETAHMTHDGSVYSVDFSPDGKYVVSGSDDFTARVWEASTGKETARMTHNSGVYSVDFSPDGKYVVSGSDDFTARVWETATGKETARMTHNSAVTSIAISSDSKYIVSGSEDSTARVWEATTGKEIARMTHDDVVRTVAFSPDSKYIVSGSKDGTTRVWEAATGKEIARMTYYGQVNSVDFSPDGKYIVSGGDDGFDDSVRVWEAMTGKEIARMTHYEMVNSVAFSPDGKFVVSGSDDNTARVWEATTGKEIARLTHDDVVRTVAFSPDVKYIVSGSDDNTARIWEAMTGKEIARMTHYPSVYSVDFSPNGGYVVSSDGNSFGGTARVWEATTGKEIAHMIYDGQVYSLDTRPGGMVYSVAFSPDGKYVVSGGADGTVRVWEATTGKEIVRMPHAGGVQSVAFSPDGKYVVSGSDDFTARVWEWQPNDVIANACKSMPRNLTRVEWTKYIGDALPYRAICENLPIEPEVTPTPIPTSTP